MTKNKDVYERVLFYLDKDEHLNQEDKEQIDLFRKNIINTKLNFRNTNENLNNEQVEKQLNLIVKLLPEKRNFILSSNNTEIQGILQSILQPIN